MFAPPIAKKKPQAAKSSIILQRRYRDATDRQPDVHDGNLWERGDRALAGSEPGEAGRLSDETQKPLPASSSILQQRYGDAASRQAHDWNLWQRGGGPLTGTEPCEAGQLSDETQMPVREVGPAWDFSSIPVLAPDRPATFSPIRLQPRLAIGALNDPLEQEANRVADQVMRMPAPDVASNSTPLQVMRSPGQPLDETGRLSGETKMSLRDLGPAWDFSSIPAFPADRPPTLLPARLQRKLAIGSVNDPLEQEADRIAEQVTRMPAPEVALSSAPPKVSRKCAQCEKEDEEKLQKKPSGTAEATSEAPASVHEVLRSSGQPLDDVTRSYFEPRFAYDFSRVRVYTSAKAAESARSVGALAYTVGQDVVFGTGQYAPTTVRGLRLLAHELVHAMQQNSNAVQSGTVPVIGHLSNGAEKEAENATNAISSNPNATVKLHRAPLPGAPVILQRKTDAQLVKACLTQKDEILPSVGLLATIGREVTLHDILGPEFGPLKKKILANTEAREFVCEEGVPAVLALWDKPTVGGALNVPAARSALRTDAAKYAVPAPPATQQQLAQCSGLNLSKLQLPRKNSDGAEFFEATDQGIRFLAAVSDKQAVQVRKKIKDVASMITKMNRLFVTAAASKLTLVIVTDGESMFRLLCGQPVLLIDTPQFTPETVAHETMHGVTEALFQQSQGTGARVTGAKNFLDQVADVFLQLGNLTIEVRPGVPVNAKNLVDPQTLNPKEASEHPGDNIDEFLSSAIAVYLVYKKALEKKIDEFGKKDPNLKAAAGQLMNLLDNFVGKQTLPTKAATTTSARKDIYFEAKKFQPTKEVTESVLITHGLLTELLFPPSKTP